MTSATGKNLLSMTQIALGAVLIAICAWITVPFTIPFTMQTFAVFMVLFLLRGKRGLISILLYLLLGLVGIPVFSGFRSGIGTLLGPTGGYILGFIATGVIFWVFEPMMKRTAKSVVFVLILGLLLCYLFGTLWFYFVYVSQGNSTTLLSVLSMCVLPFILPDFVKIGLACFISKKIRKYLK